MTTKTIMDKVIENKKEEEKTSLIQNELKSFSNLPEAISFKLFAIVNLVKGLYSKEVILYLLKGKINLSKASSLI